MVTGLCARGLRGVIRGAGIVGACVLLWVAFAHPGVAIAETDGIFAWPRMSVAIDGREYRLAVADSPARREKGLSGVGRDELARRGLDGMLFVFENEGEYQFQAWFMKFDLVLVGLDRREGRLVVVDRRRLPVGTVVAVKGRYVAELAPPIK